ELRHVAEGVQADAEAAALGEGSGVVTVEAHEGRQVEGSAEAVLALGEQEAEALVGLPGGAEAGELAHGPEPAAVHGGVDAAGERVLAGVAEVGVRVEAVEAFRGGQRLDGGPAGRGGRRRAPAAGGRVL